MDEEPKDEASWEAWAAAQEDWWRRQSAAELDWWKRQAAQEEEVIRQNNLMYGGLIGIGIVMVQPFFTANAGVIGLPAKICLIAFSIAVPLLATLLLLNRQEVYRRRAASTALVHVARQVALGAGFTGVVAGFWHIMPAAGMAALACGFVGIFIHGSGYRRVELDHAKAAQKPDDAQPVQEKPPPKT